MPGQFLTRRTARAEANRTASLCMESPCKDASREIWQRHSSARLRLPDATWLAHLMRSWIRCNPLSSGFKASRSDDDDDKEEEEDDDGYMKMDLCMLNLEKIVLVAC